jgi:hypothetical protein
MTTTYTLDELEGVIRCDCGAKYWHYANFAPHVPTCVSCGALAPMRPETTQADVRSNFRYARMIMSEITKELTDIGANDDPRLHMIDLDELAMLCNELQGSIATFATYLDERGVKF